ncbi:MAG: ATP-dependent sacrificial sulfur transferase LarE [Oscillospiraceae bacterium]|nr:ATP-dependent sacrificial sulfur transferase LarE [Oscillospiraceae bacterium]
MLKAFFEENPRVAVAFSGGTDSAYLLYQAAKYAQSVTAYCVKSIFQPESERDDVRQLANELGVKFRIVLLDILADKTVAKNTEERCYYCKKALFQRVKEWAWTDGYTVIIDGSNADDDPAQRPGMKALEELGVRSPMREAGLSKADIRRLSKEAGLFTWDKPSNSCAATRVPTGVKLTAEMLRKIKDGEEKLKELGFSDLRLRWRDGAAKLELPAEQLALAIEKRNDIIAALGEDFTEISLDLKGRRVT